ncbi:MAG TPA: hypothetical protein VK694_01045 [Verrucomicrobiae bacterium]|nr:hypothetical protein [Verrucomicrobiae bacterium]
MSILAAAASTDWTSGEIKWLIGSIAALVIGLIAYRKSTDASALEWWATLAVICGVLVTVITVGQNSYSDSPAQVRNREAEVELVTDYAVGYTDVDVSATNDQFTAMAGTCDVRVYYTVAGGKVVEAHIATDLTGGLGNVIDDVDVTNGIEDLYVQKAFSQCNRPVTTPAPAA